MRHLPRVLELPIWVCAVLAFGAGFGVAWWCISAREPVLGTSRTGPLAGSAEVRATVTAGSRSREPEAGSTVFTRPIEPTRDPAAVRKSRLPEWMRFRYEHPRLAPLTEMAVRLALDSPVPAREIMSECATKLHIEAVRDLDISAELTLDGREATVRGWGCEANEEASIAAQICDCILGRLPGELQMAVPREVPEEDLARYEGMLSLRLWL